MDALARAGLGGVCLHERRPSQPHSQTGAGLSRRCADLHRLKQGAEALYGGRGVELQRLERRHVGRRKAAALGANGVILASMKDASTGAKIANAFLGTGANRKGNAIAIYIPSDTSRVAAACKTST